MAVLSRSVWRRRMPLVALVAAAVGFSACADSAGPGADPVLPGNPVIPPQYRGAAFEFEINATKRTVKVTPPRSSTINSSLAPSLDIKAGDIGVNQSLLGPEVIDISVVAGSFVAGPLNTPSPGKRLISFDVVINNKLNGVELITPTFPIPPAGATGPLLFPFEVTITATAGGATGGAGQIVVVPPRGGAVTINADWDGAPHNFFNDVGCGAGSNDCFRYEEFTAVPALGSSNARKVGFEIDASVGDFVVKVIAAADLRNAGGPAQSGSVAGTVTSPQIGNIANAVVSVSGGFTGNTAANGSYSIANVGVGARTVTVGGLPSGCTTPAGQNVTVTNGGTATANFTVACTTPTGTVTGTITSSLGGGLSGVAVTLTPTGSPALPVFTTGPSGTFTFTVPVGAGTGAIAIANLPANCTNPGATNYTGLTSGGTTTQNIAVTCSAPAQVGTVSGTLTRSDNAAAIAGASVVLTPSAAPALAGVPTNATGAYSAGNVPIGGGTIAVTGLPSGCTFGGDTYAGVTNGGTVTKNLVATCVAAPFQYPFTGTWGAITSTGPTGRQVTLTLTIDMGAAPGNPAVNGNNADELVGIQLSLNYAASLLTYASRVFIDPNLDFGAAGSPSAGLTNVAVTSSQSLTSSGVVSFVRITYNIPTGASGTVAPTASFVEVLAGTPTANTDVKANVTSSLPTLVIP